LEASKITLEHRSGGGPSTSLVEEAQTTNLPLTELATGHKTLQIEIETINFLMPELQEHMKTLSHLNILVSKMPTHILQSLQVSILHEIRLSAYEEHREMTKVMDERAQLQQQYATTL
jgi:hypothetical protein